jgi:predicted nucleic acid-binding protein
LRHNLSVYDASYVALAEALRAPLVTADSTIAESPTVNCEVELLAVP